MASSAMVEAKLVPARDDLRAWLLEASEALYPGRGGETWAPSADYYRKHKPPEWCQTQRLLGAYGFERSIQGWERLVRDVAGLRVPDQGQVMGWRQERRDLRRLGPVPRLGRAQNAYETDVGGIHCVVRRVTVVAWDWRTKTWPVVGYRLGTFAA